MESIVVHRERLIVARVTTDAKRKPKYVVTIGGHPEAR